MGNVELNALDYAGMVLIPIPWVVFYIVITSHYKNLTSFNALLTIFRYKNNYSLCTLKIKYFN